MAALTGKERILIVDDDPNILELLRRHLRARGYEVATTPDVGEATRVLAKISADLVIIALKMPKRNGPDLTNYVRKSFIHTEVIIVTGYATIREAVKTAKAGAAEYLIKPFTEEELFAVVQKALSKLSRRQAAEAQACPI